MTKKSPEKRQRVLLSNKYTEAIQDVNEKLDHISESLKSISGRHDNVQPFLQNGTIASHSSTLSDLPGTTHHSSGVDLDACSGFRGSSSFEAHAKQLKERLRKTDDVQDLWNDQHNKQSDTNNSTCSAFQACTTSRRFAEIKTSSQEVGRSQTEVIDERNLLPRDLVLKILRLIQIEKQRFFVDIPIIDEGEFAEHCKQFYCASEPCSISALAIATVGMYYLIHDLDIRHYGAMELTTSLVDDYLHGLRGKAYSACQDLRVCTELSFDNCKTLSLLAMFSLKDGRIETAWGLLSSAARMCLDLGTNCSQQADHKDQTNSNRLLRWLYAVNQSLALTLGRSPTIRRCDLDLDCLDLVARGDGMSSP